MTEVRRQNKILRRGLVFRDVGMIKRVYIVLLGLLLAGCAQSDSGEGGAVLQVDEGKAATEISKQLRINREALLSGRGEQIRIEAANVMMFSEEAAARKILIEVLKQSENRDARTAVCKALSQTALTGEPVKDKQDFVQPLLEILKTADLDGAKPAAESLLIFEYEQISQHLEEMVTDSSLPEQARVNVIYALKLQPDKRAIIKLVSLFDGPPMQPQVAAAAQDALESMGIPAARDAEIRREIVRQLVRKDRDEFLMDSRIRQQQQERIRQLEKKLQLWQKQYLSASDKIYAGLKEDAVKGQFLSQHLQDSESIVRLWALEKVSQWRKGTKPQLPAELGPILVDLVSDQNRDVRLKTTELLSLMVELDSAELLLKQLETEQDGQVQMELLVALGARCYYGLLPNSDAEIRPQIRKQTLEWGAKYLSEPQREKAQKGAEVIRKLLEQDGLTGEEVDRYLGLLSARFGRQTSDSEGLLRGELLTTMASLCARSVYRAQAADLFKPLFEEALSDRTELVREAAVDGLVYIDKTEALNVLRKGFVEDSSIIVRQKVIELAGEVGGQQDLVWLSKKTSLPAESDSAWQAMLKIFRRCEVGVLEEWMDKFASAETGVGLSDEQKISFLETAERKAVGDNKIEMVKVVRGKQALAYTKSGEFERAAQYLGLLVEAAETVEEKEEILASLLDVYLRWSKTGLAVQLMSNCLLEKDLGPDNCLVLSIDNYLITSGGTAEAGAVLGALNRIETGESRPMWREQLRNWNRRLGQADEVPKPKEVSVEN